MHMQNEGRQLREYVRGSGKTQEGFASELNMTRQNLNNYFLMEQLPTDFKKTLEKNGHFLFANKIATPTGVPYLGELDIFAGNGQDLTNSEISEYISGYIAIPGFRKASYYVNVYGNSMYGRYCSGDIIAIQKIHDLTEIQFGQVYVIVTTENRVIKYVRKGSDTNHLKLVSENPKFDDYEIERRKVKAMFLVLGKITKDVL